MTGMNMKQKRNSVPWNFSGTLALSALVLGAVILRCAVFLPYFL